MVDPAVKHLIEVLIDDMRTQTSGGLERFLTTLALDGGRKDYEEWAASPMTRVFLGALKSMAETVPLANASDHAGLAKAFGCMTGLNLVVRLIEDPTRVFPGIYEGAAALMSRQVRSDLDETYEAPADGEDDSKKGQ